MHAKLDHLVETSINKFDVTSQMDITLGENLKIGHNFNLHTSEHIEEN